MRARKLLRWIPIILAFVAIAAGELNDLLRVRLLQDCNFPDNTGRGFAVIAGPWLVLAAAHFGFRKQASGMFDIWALTTSALAAFFVYLNFRFLLTTPFSANFCGDEYFREFNDAAMLVQFFIVIPYTAISIIAVFLAFLIEQALTGDRGEEDPDL